MLLLSFGAFVAWGIPVALRKAREQEQQALAARVNAAFEENRGAATARVFRDPQVLTLLANDAESVANLTAIDLSMVSFRDYDPSDARKLINVKTIMAYSCHEFDKLLNAMQGSPALEQIVFCVSDYTDNTAELLTKFPNLKRVRFVDYASQDFVAPLKSKLPNVEIDFQ